ncbi:hypothetical protein ACF0H5_022783 [Mactra antiquata]
MGARASFPMVTLTKNRIIVVTGANTGIGYEIAKHCAFMGATVILACRSEARARNAMERMQQEYESEVITAHGENNRLAIEFMHVDLSSFKSVVTFCDEFKKTGRQLHVLFCNAGLGMAPYSVTVDGLELILQANYLGHFLMIAKLLDVMKRSGPDCRILLTASSAHSAARRIDISTMNFTGNERDYSQIVYYGRSKAYQIMQAITMTSRLKGSNISVNSFHPGLVATEFGRYINNSCLKCCVKCICGCGCARTPIQGATCGIDLAVNPDYSGVSGHYWIDCRITEPKSCVRNEETQIAVWRESFKFLKDYLTEDEINAMEGK